MSMWCIVVATLGSQLTDYCLDQTETPLRAFTLDVCNLEDQQRAFNLQTAFIGKCIVLHFLFNLKRKAIKEINMLFGNETGSWH